MLMELPLTYLIFYLKETGTRKYNPNSSRDKFAIWGGELEKK